MRIETVIVVPHVHWDREWYFTAQESQLLAARDFTEVLDFMESHPDYPSYILDGQMAVVDEYCDTVPGARERVERLVRQGRLHVGPWYTQSDQMIVGAEPIVRNLLYGRASAEALGRTMQIGYVPDSFGQSAQMPMIMSGFGIERYVFWRGQSEFCGTESNQFAWTSPDGSSVTAFQLPLGYATGKYLETDAEALRERLGSLFELMDELASVPVAILPNGHDQMPIQRNVDEVMEALREAFPGREFRLGSLEDAFEELEGRRDGAELPRARGELLDGKRERVHRSIYSVRNDLTAMNSRTENLLARRVEPLCTVASELGLAYPERLIRQAWKLLFENHAHDSMGACCSDVVNAQIGSRHLEASERARLLEHYAMRQIAESVVSGPGEPLVLFNMDAAPDESRLVMAEVTSETGCFELLDASGVPVKFDVLSQEEIDPGLVDRQIVAGGDYRPFVRTRIQLRRELPAMGYETLRVVGIEGKRLESSAREGGRSFETDFYRVRVRPDGTIDVETVGGARYEGVLALEVEGNDGDEYDFSPLAGGGRLLSPEVAQAETRVVEHEHTVEVSISYALDVPALLEGWLVGGPAETCRLGVRMRLVFDRCSRAIDVDVTLENQANDLRVRLLVPTGIASEVSIADNQFGVIERPIVDPALAVWERDGWSERPDAVFPFLSYVALADEGRTVAVLTNSTREYEVVGERRDTLAVTLLACVGTLGKADLVRRPGRPSGIALATPDSQCHGVTSFSLGLLLADAPFAEARPARVAQRWLTPPTAYHRFRHVPLRLNDTGLELPARQSLFSQGSLDLVLSSLKRSEDGERTLARFFNPTSRPQRLELEGAVVRGRCRLDETPLEEGTPSWDGVVGPHGVVTVVLEVPAAAAGAL